MHKETRLYFLDGLRGWAAFCVFLGHLGLTSTEPMSVFYHSLSHVPFRLLMEGWDAVVLFFLISGSALSCKFFIDHDVKSIVRMAQFRYVRLAIPVFFAVLFVYVCLASGLMVDPGNTNFDTSYWGFLKNLYNSLFTYNDFTSYNPNLWTIPVEILGSFLVFSILSLFGTSKLRYAVYFLSIILLLKTFYVCFVIGLLVCDIYSKDIGGPLRKNKYSLCIDFILVGLFFYRLPYSLNLYVSEASFSLSGILLPSSYTSPPFCVFFSFILVFLSPLLQKLFASRIFLFMGRISFALYLFHWPIIWVVFSKPITSFIEMLFYKVNLFSMSSWFQVFFCILLSILYAYYFTIFVEEKLLKRVKNFMFSHEFSFEKPKEWGVRIFQKMLSPAFSFNKAR